jgi:TonB family protein
MFRRPVGGGPRWAASAGADRLVRQSSRPLTCGSSRAPVAIRQALRAALAVLVVTVGPLARAAPAPSPAASSARPALRYQIPPQPLTSALEAFTGASGVQLLYDAALAAGRRSPGVTGEKSPEDALAAILAGSGLQATFVRSNAVYIYPARDSGAAPGGGDGRGPGAPSPGAVMALGVLHVEAPALTIGHPRYDRYAAALQAGVQEALETAPAARHGSWSTAAELQLNADGAVRKARLISSTGDAKIDAVVLAVLSAARLPPPPDGLPQPVTVRISAAGTS